MPTESTFLLAFLFIIAAAAGWVFAHYSSYISKSDIKPLKIHSDYIKGLNLVLNKKNDEALELFTKLAKIDDDTLETHFALGHLFRRRGETDRAIKVHQNILARPNLNNKQRQQALFSLAQDYYGAGLFGRAESIFSQLTNESGVNTSALEQLVDIYEKERNWEKAINVHRKLELVTGKKSPQIAHYYCELAEISRLSGDLDSARKHLKSSVRSESGVYRGNLIRAAIAKEDEDFAQAIRLYQKSIEFDKRLLVEVLPNFLFCYKKLNRENDFSDYINQLVSKDGNTEYYLAYSSIINQLSTDKNLYKYVLSFYTNHDLISEFIDLDYFSSISFDKQINKISNISNILRKIALESSRYCCTVCGYGAKRIIWQCPSCKQWETVMPKQIIEFEKLFTKAN
ncbi:MAG: hypothetical protein VYC50_06060 [Pseudomonadota bacterium]|nr:hypothetical protein [Gammaproteobacteria bacterium]MEE2684652.1 hypothetical protein [Pseudomonadota bacterium]|tara:strand:- start:3754 stop:4950 length:1197 start_codon:yes stop_codon:yes gene_type:complete